MKQSEIGPVNDCVIGVVGLGVMGANLALNLASNLREPIAAYDINAANVQRLVEGHPDLSLKGAASLNDFVSSLTSPRVVLLMVPAGPPVDVVTDELLGLLHEGDLIIDGGNSHYKDTQERVERCKSRGILFLGMGVSGGEQGALLGPALMAGGDPAVWEVIQPIFEPIAALAGDDLPCVALVGSGASGHFTKMVHNGIEYADLQLIGEAYALLRATGRTAAQAGEIFAQWNVGDDRSYLLDSVEQVLLMDDALGSGSLIDAVSCAAKGKGTGAWTVIAGAELGMSVSIIAEALFARSVSSARDERDAWLLQHEIIAKPVDLPIETVRDAYLAARLLAYQQGMTLLAAASNNYGWDVRLEDVVRIWRAGCIIRAGFLDKVRGIYQKEDATDLFVTDPAFYEQIIAGYAPLQEVSKAAAISSVHLPSTSAALNHLIALRSRTLPTALVQLLRDYFGAHTFERTDLPGSFHVSWESDRQIRKQ